MSLEQNPPSHSLSTRAVHTAAPADVQGRPVSVPIYQTTVYAHDDPALLTDSLDNPRGAFGYSRMANPTVRALENAVAGLEGAVGAVATASGMAAIHTALGANLRAGGHLVVQDSIYGGTTGLLNDLAARWDIRISQVPGDDPVALAAALTPDTAAVYLETISNPVTSVADVAGMSAVARERGVLTVVDNTFASPVLCRPLQLGADIVLHSATKYLGGHSDVTAGLVCYAADDAFVAGWKYAVATGPTMDPFGAWLVIRGLQTLALRVAAATDNAVELAARLAGHPGVGRVHHPSRPDHPQHALAERMLDGPGPMLAFDVTAGRQAAMEVLGRLRLLQNAPSLGGVETLAMHPASTSHRHYDAAALEQAGITDGTIRISTGVEDVEDLWADLSQALTPAR
ncbi:trans-sulfuration enzyme family protein [Nakamurella lactea]|uniref:trans-sulfuration enzyme family protein n=1 Tax=Nakamurella lactea TaxID=459515 RepID=UPI001B7FEE93|nr:aminotransferase class I/II-fold pyridoxal phosphate-dependent enzyme [Nakamurella lactea]